MNACELHFHENNNDLQSVCVFSSQHTAPWNTRIDTAAVPATPAQFIASTAAAAVAGSESTKSKKRRMALGRSGADGDGGLSLSVFGESAMVLSRRW